MLAYARYTTLRAVKDWSPEQLDFVPNGLSNSAALLLAPILVLVAVWMYTVIFVFAACWFTHFCLAELQLLRDAQHTHLASEI